MHGCKRVITSYSIHYTKLYELVQEDLQAALQIGAHEALQRISVEPDDLAQQLPVGHHRLFLLQRQLLDQLV